MLGGMGGCGAVELEELQKKAPAVWHLTFPSGSVSKESACNAGDPGSVARLERSPGERNGNSLQYSCLGNPMDRRAWRATGHGIAELNMAEQLTLSFLWQPPVIWQRALLEEIELNVRKISS